MNITQTSIDPLGKSIPYVEKNFEVGLISSIIHTFILIFFAELGDKSFIMLFILQLRTNKVTIFYSALLAEILMNSLAALFGFLLDFLLYKNLIDYLGILFFVIYGIFLILWGFKKNDNTFELEFEMIEEMIKKNNTKRSSMMILGVDNDEEINDDNNIKNDNDKYNLENVNIINDKTYIPNIKKELTIIPEGDISREDSIISEGNTSKFSAIKSKNIDEDDNEFILGNKNNNSNFSLKLKKGKKPNEKSDKKNHKEKNLEENINNININKKLDFNDNINEEENIKNEENEENDENIDEKNKIKKYKSRYYLDYFDKNIDIDKPYIDTSIFGTIFLSICISEFGDRTQLISFASSSLFHFWGSLLGSCFALFFSCLLATYYTKTIVKNLKQKYNDFILGIIFLAIGIQIYIFKLQNRNTI